jgi:hypothetical protein
LAGSLFVIHYGVPTPLSLLDERSQLRMCQALILKLRILIPAFFGPTILSGIAVVLLDGSGSGFVFRDVGVFLVIVCFLFALLGTAPINAAILAWKPNNPPKTWREQVGRWERFDATRTWLGVVSFAILLSAMAFRVAGG